MFISIVLIFCALTPYVWLYSAAQKEIRKMEKTSPKTGEVAAGILTAQDGHANVFLVKCSSGYIAIDAGEKPANLLKALDKLRIDPRQICTVLLTHTDLDHAGAVSLFKNADVFISKEEEPLINGKRFRTFSRFKLPLPNKLKAEYEVVEDRRTLLISDRKVECIVTPGHTPGSTCFLIDDTYLFTGDTLVLNKGKVEPFIGLFTMDRQMNQESIRKLAKRIRGRQISHMFTAHHGYTGDVDKAFTNWT